MTSPTAGPIVPTPTYAVTGATGHLGRLAVSDLLRREVPAGSVFALVRDPSRADELRGLGVGVREADYDRPETLRAALEGIERLLLASGSEVGRRVDQHGAVIEAARAADVGYVAYTSVLRADATELALAPEHAATERLLRESGLPHAVARNGWYTENYTGRIDEYLARGEIVGAAGNGHVAAATRADYAAAAVTLLLGDIPDQVGVHELGGPAFTMTDLAAAITDVTGTTVTYRDVAAAELAAEMVEAGADPATAEFVAALDTSIARGELDTDSDELSRLLGRDPTPLVDVVRAARL